MRKGVVWICVTLAAAGWVVGCAAQRSVEQAQLSLDRANAVGAALRTKGVPESQIEGITVGAGATEDFTPDATTNQDEEANRRGNRRVVLTFRHTGSPGAGGGAGTGGGGGSGTP